MTSTAESSPDVCWAISFSRLWGSVRFLICKINSRRHPAQFSGSSDAEPGYFRLNNGAQRKERSFSFCFPASPLKQTPSRKQPSKLPHVLLSSQREEGEEPLSSCAPPLPPTGGSVITSAFTFLCWWWSRGGGGGRGGGTYVLECSVDCLRHAPDVVVAVFLRILCKEQLANFSDCRLYFHNSSRRVAATRRPLRLQKRNVTVRSQNTTKFQIAP